MRAAISQCIERMQKFDLGGRFHCERAEVFEHEQVGSAIVRPPGVGRAVLERIAEAAPVIGAGHVNDRLVRTIGPPQLGQPASQVRFPGPRGAMQKQRAVQFGIGCRVVRGRLNFEIQLAGGTRSARLPVEILQGRGDELVLGTDEKLAQMLRPSEARRRDLAGVGASRQGNRHNVIHACWAVRTVASKDRNSSHLRSPKLYQISGFNATIGRLFFDLLFEAKNA